MHGVPVFPMVLMVTTDTSQRVPSLQESVVKWDEALSSLRAVLEGWLEVQAKWAQIAPLFGPRGVADQLPLEVRCSPAAPKG